jgi:hypothetical protein
MTERRWWGWCKPVHNWWSSKAWPWITANRYWLVSIFVSVASAPGDGGYISRYIHPAFAYTWNFAVDAATEMAMHAFVSIWRRPSSRLRKWFSILLLLCHFAMFYFAVVFAHAEFVLKQPDQASYLHWSLAAFGPGGLTTLAIAQALMETRTKTTTTKKSPPPLRDPTVQDKRHVLASLNGDGAMLTVDSWNAALNTAGFVSDNPSTARHWVEKAKDARS